MPAAALSGLLCVATWSADAHHAMNQYAEVVAPFRVRANTGVLADRNRELELQRVNRELQESFGQIRRAASLA